MNVTPTSLVVKPQKHAIFSKDEDPSGAPASANAAVAKDFLESTTGAAKKTAFARMNEAWFTKSSSNTHAYFESSPRDWHAYHDTFRDARGKWEMVPADKMIETYRCTRDLRIGDFGCGEGMIGAALRNQHTVFSFDHIAVDDSVTACDIAHVPLAAATLDVAIFSLALMGENFTGYIEEGHRTLRLGGTLHILEMSRRFVDQEGFLRGLRNKGFEICTVEEMWKFTHILAVKNSNHMASNEPLSF